MNKAAAILISIIILLTCIPVSAMEDATINFDKAYELLLKNNNELKELKREENNSYAQYQEALSGSNATDINGITYYFGGEKFFFEFDSDVKVMMTKKKELYPEQAKFGWDSAKNNLDIKKRNLSYSLRDSYLELLKASLDMDEKSKVLKLETEKNQLEKKKFEKGIVSKLDFDEAEYNLLVSKKEYECAERTFENANRSYNLMVGNKLEELNTTVAPEELVASIGLFSEEDCIKLALKNRDELISLRTQVKLKELGLELIKRNDMVNKYKDLKDEYEEGLLEIERLNAELDKAEYSVSYEIGSTYPELIKGYALLKNSLNELMTSRADFNRIEAQFKKNLIPKQTYLQGELKLLSEENKYKIDVFSYNTKVMKFKNAIGLGPAY